MLDEGQLKLRS